MVQIAWHTVALRLPARRHFWPLNLRIRQSLGGAKQSGIRLRHDVNGRGFQKGAHSALVLEPVPERAFQKEIEDTRENAPAQVNTAQTTQRQHTIASHPAKNFTEMTKAFPGQSIFIGYGRRGDSLRGIQSCGYTPYFRMRLIEIQQPLTAQNTLHRHPAEPGP